ncbi:hypothetical protein LX32DRAFT_16965 [Colletotrichum zoysiae]|uniref:Uncharacterized protein n=1 Tax=Colletotrichum zoysiae TaxID=1216348 RepID=A0AAD9HE17_9PEZI|nr:hypothetical protein LX32DRAFT_16965 [Colletotrichum zoysiae]
MAANQPIVACLRIRAGQSSSEPVSCGSSMQPAGEFVAASTAELWVWDRMTCPDTYLTGRADPSLAPWSQGLVQTDKCWEAGARMLRNVAGRDWVARWTNLTTAQSRDCCNIARCAIAREETQGRCNARPPAYLPTYLPTVGIAIQADVRCSMNKRLRSIHGRLCRKGR